MFNVGINYNFSLLNGVIALPNNVIYRFFKLCVTTSLIVGIHFLSASAKVGINYNFFLLNDVIVLPNNLIYRFFKLYVSPPA